MATSTPPRPRRPLDPDALIEEARRRARRRRAVYAAAALLALAGGAGLLFGRGGGAGVADGTPAPAAPPPSPARQERLIDGAAARATIVDAGVARSGAGWAMNGLGMWLTSDGGDHWRATSPVLPGGDVVARVGQVTFVDAEHGWVSGLDLIGDVVGKDGSDRFAMIERTIDGGRTWRTSAHDCVACGGHLFFLDARRGWAITGLQPAPQLFRTADGGATWRLVGAAPFTGSIEFLDARRGFGVTWSGRLFRTTDGGHTWARSLGTVAGLPRFFGPDGVVAARSGGVYVTADGGRAWARRATPAVDAQRLQLSAASQRTWYLWSGSTLYRTDDAGRRWTRVPMAVSPDTLWDLTFTSSQRGWAIFGVGNGAALVRTRDGGRDWLPLTPQGAGRARRSAP